MRRITILSTITESHMYENFKTWNWGIGCNFNPHCSYCKKSFQNLIKRCNPTCQECADYTWHVHQDRLDSDVVPNAKLIFPCACGDISFADLKDIDLFLTIAGDQPEKTFVPQSKNPICFHRWERNLGIPSNIIFATTVESNMHAWIQPLTTTVIHYNDDISGAPPPSARLRMIQTIEHKRKELVIEPVLGFEPNYFIEEIKAVEPEVIYIGYANHGYKLPEPSLNKTLALIEELEKFTEVRKKSIRKAWWEDTGWKDVY